VARAQLIALAAATLVACSGGDSPVDAGVPDAGPPPGTIEVGTGIVAFEAIDPQTPLDLVPGPQASGRYEGYHVWTALRLTDVVFEDLETYTVRMYDGADTQIVELVRAVETSPFEEDAEGRWVLSGIAPRISDCCLVSEGDFEIEGVVTYADGRALSARAAGRAGLCDEMCP